ncbi:MAG: hypothetical protein U5R31_00780 [Acidimicrobiia bacterium]|nr:hypothetical protein [Acidimicrobiia bacterium]
MHDAATRATTRLAGSDFEDRLAGIEISLDAEVEIIDETTAEVTIEDGTLDGNAEFDCAAVDAVVEEGETVTLVYPDGETTCDDL